MSEFIYRYPRLMKGLLLSLGLVSVYVLALGSRRFMMKEFCARLRSDYGFTAPEVPFTLESALHYRRIEMLSGTNGVPAVDRMVGAPEGIPVRQTYEFGSERVQAFLAGLLPGSISLTARLRWVEEAWFSTGAVFLCLWIWWWLRDRSAAAFAGLIYAISMGAVDRSTGLELSKENFALPLLLADLAFAARARLATDESSTGWSLLSAFFLGWSLWNWDLIQFYTMIWAALGAVEAARGQWGRDPQGRRAWTLGSFAIVAVAFLSPYYRAHGLLASPTVLLLLLTAVHQAVMPVVSRKWLPDVAPWKVFAVLAGVGLLIMWVTRYGAAYQHFSSLLWAKIRHLNVKPLDPRALTFEQRIMWVPALHSATWDLTFYLFPALLPVSLVAALVALRGIRLADSPCIRLVVFYLVSLVAFVFFARLQVYLAIFACAMTGWGLARAVKAGRWLPHAALAIALIAVSVEGSNLYRNAKGWVRANVYYTELVQLTDWLSSHVPHGATVLAQFTVSGAIAAYGQCAIVLHPKFEDPVIRDRVQSFGENLFKGTLMSLRDWADSMGAEYFVYSKGEFSSYAIQGQMRYFVDALAENRRSPAYRFEFHQEEFDREQLASGPKSRWFRYLWGNKKYAVYKIFTQADADNAKALAARAQTLLGRKQFEEAGRLAVQALMLDPEEATAQEILRWIGARKT